MVAPAPGKCPALPAADLRPPASPRRLAKLIACLFTWGERRRQRRHLLSLSTYMLKDIGLTRADVEFECRKYPWQH
ncbi:DUF1127 domain-containing protein [Dongia sp.]|uniref:DUF1127 domain-containing protein n=1 Tax=Dongia sp. TaxID=1977262 RepID=UPI0035B0F674